jgi:integrase
VSIRNLARGQRIQFALHLDSQIGLRICRRTALTVFSPVTRKIYRFERPGARVEVGDRITPKAIWHVVKAAAKRADIKNLAPHDLRRTCARLCHLAGGELEQIQFLLGHASVQTTERYLGCKQRLSHAVNDNLGLEGT